MFKTRVQNRPASTTVSTGSDTPRSMLLGYARVSTTDQNPQLQLDALNQTGCEKIYTDHASGAATARPKLDEMLHNARNGDSIIVWRLDRLGRSMKHLLDLTADLERRGIGLRSLNEQIDTTTANGRLIFHVMAALAEFERGLLSERTQAGLQAARAQGRVGGRPRALAPQAEQTVLDLRASGKTVTDIAATLKVSRATVYRALDDSRAERA